MGQWDRVIASKVVGPVETFEFVNVRSHPYWWVRLDLELLSSMLSVPSCCKKELHRTRSPPKGMLIGCSQSVAAFLLYLYIWGLW